MPARTTALIVSLVLSLAVALSSCAGYGVVTTSEPTPIVPAAPYATGTAADALASLPVKGRAPRTGYDRQEFGQAWTDDVDEPYGHNGCDTRNDILGRDLVRTTRKPGTRGCVVLAGTFPDPYGGREIAFTRGQTTSTAVQIDHVVALSDAWQTGAQSWDAERRTRFANDPLNLLASAGSLNASKRDSDAATWLPPYRPFRCEYVARQIAVKVRHGLWVKPAERDAMGRVLAGCPGQPLPGAADAGRPTATAAMIPAASAGQPGREIPVP